MDYASFFEKVTGRVPFPYQRVLSEGEWPELVDIPTGLGKTAALGVAWLYRRSRGDLKTPRRLVWCLPMRSLVDQTYHEFKSWVNACADEFEHAPSVNMLMGGHKELDWANYPERDAVVIGTQDMLISRALMRGYGMSRYAWPMHYAWLHNDALWVFDETQLMGVSVPTSAQLEGFRQSLGTAAPTHSIWMSATLSSSDMNTVDHREPESGWRVHELGELDRESDAVLTRVHAQKALAVSENVVDRETTKSGAGVSELVDEIINAHREGSLTLVVLNRVSRAQDLFQEVKSRAGDTPVALLHSRFRQAERAAQAELLKQIGDRIVIATQVVEAGIDISARTLFTELAPWPSLVQRFGRCNRYGEFDDAEVRWIDLAPKDEKDGDVLLPYSVEEIDDARKILNTLDDVGPQSVRAVDWQAPDSIWPIVRKRDLLELFDTTADLSGNDLDVSRYIRDGDDTDVAFYWRELGDESPTKKTPAPDANELCRVSIGQARNFTSKDKTVAWRFLPLEGVWKQVSKQSPPRPGEVILVDSASGGYEPELGFVGPPKKKKFDSVPPVLLIEKEAMEGYDSDEKTYINRWIRLEEHTEHVVEQVQHIANALSLDAKWTEWLTTAAQWHDVGKAHEVFQTMLLTTKKDSDELAADPNVLWAKSDHSRGRAARKHFRHELASALAFLQSQPVSEDTNAIAYIIAAHHGKVRLSIRSLPDEKKPQDDSLFARGVWQGDCLPLQIDESHESVDNIPKIELDLSPMRLGHDSWLERCLELRDSPDVGPFRMAFLESLLRTADQRASAEEKVAKRSTVETDSASSPKEVL